MSRIKKLILVCLFANIISSTSYAVTLEEALINAYKNNPELNAQRDSLRASDERIMQALARWLPTITATASKQYQKFKNFGINTPNFSEDGHANSLTISQNLFRSGADIASIKVAKAQINQARANLNDKEQEVLLKTVQAYMDVLSRKEIYNATQIKEKDNTRLLIGTQQRFKAGDASKTDVALAEAELSKAKVEKAAAQANYEISKASFKATIGMIARNLTLPKSKFILPKTIGETLDTAVIKNPKIVAAKNSADASKQNIHVQRGNVSPTVSLQHTISDNTRQPLANNDHSQATTIELSIPLFAPSNWSQLRQTKREAAQAQNSLFFTTKTIKANAAQAWASFIASKKTLKARDAEYKARKVAYNGAQAQEKAGLISTLDIITFQNEYFTAYANFISARSDYYVSLYTLKSIVGECTAKELKLNTEYYDPLKNYNSIKWQLIGAF